MDSSGAVDLMCNSMSDLLNLDVITLTCPETNDPIFHESPMEVEDNERDKLLCSGTFCGAGGTGSAASPGLSDAFPPLDTCISPGPSSTASLRRHGHKDHDGGGASLQEESQGGGGESC